VDRYRSLPFGKVANFMVRTTRETGASIAEYAGSLIVISAIVGGVVVTGVADRVAEACVVAVCRAFGGDCRLDAGASVKSADARNPDPRRRDRPGAPARASGRQQPRPPRPPIRPRKCVPNPKVGWTEGLHSHNDYDRENPLRDALDHGATSVEADIHLEDGRLEVKHDADDDSTGTLRELYIDPLIRRARRTGQIYEGRKAPFELYIEIKEGGVPAFRRALKEVEDLPKGVNVIFDPANIPRHLMRRSRPGVSFAFTPGDNCTIPPELDPRHPRYDPAYARNATMFNGSFEPAGGQETSCGDLFFPGHRRHPATAFREAHDAGYKVRIVGGPDGDDDNSRAWWRGLLKFGVDYLDTRHLTAGQRFLRSCGREG
jgi:hypothetical protein